MELIVCALVGFVAGVAAVIVAAAAVTMSPRPSLEQQGRLAELEQGRLAELDPAEVARRVQGHEHAWELASMGRGFVRSERCACGATRLQKGGAR